jgi:RNA polymerase primary sigma factor
MTGSQETVEDEKTYTPEETIQHADMLTRLRELLDSIDERQATILRLRYGLGESQEPMTLKDIGKVVGLTRERVRQIERETLARLSRVMEGH